MEELENPVICELGIGTGRWTREIIKKLNNKTGWKIYLADHSEWIIEFLKNYFKDEDRIIPVQNDGRSLSFAGNDFFDIIFSQGMFIELNLSTIVSYSIEFHRTLKPGGLAAFNYINLNSTEGWNHLLINSQIADSCFTYYASETIDNIFFQTGFEKINSILLGNSTYDYFRKKQGA